MFMRDLLAKIEAIAGASRWRRDLLALTYLLYGLLTLLAVLAAASVLVVDVIATTIKPAANHETLGFVLDLSTGELTGVLGQDLLIIAQVAGVLVLAYLASYLQTRYLKKFRFTAQITVSLLLILGLVAIFSAWYEAAILAAITVAILGFFPLGSGRYVQIICRISYLAEIRRLEAKRTPIRKGRVALKYLIIIAALTTVVLIANHAYQVSFRVILILVLALGAVLFISGDNDKLLGYYKKVGVYAVLIVLGAVLKSKIQLDSRELFLVFASVFFSFYKLAGLSKDLDRLVRDESLQFYLDCPEDDSQTLTDRLIDLRYLRPETCDEHELVQQIIIRHKLHAEDEVAALCETYRSRGLTQYWDLVQGLRV